MSGIESLSPTQAWDLILAADALVKRDSPGELFANGYQEPSLVREVDGRWQVGVGWGDETRDFLELYLPLCGTGADSGWVVGHLGQSIDGHIATEVGDSVYVTGPQNIMHLHRMRALCDAVVVGARTVESDNPRLTTRLVEGPSPTRVIVDPKLRLGADFGVFADDAAPTIVACAQHALNARASDCGHAKVLAVAHDGDWLNLGALLTRLRAKGYSRLFIEGGGITVSSFLRDGLLDRLQVAIAPLVIGSGRPGLRLPAIDLLAQGLRPLSRTYRMGEDVMFDLTLTPGEQAGAGTRAADSGDVS